MEINPCPFCGSDDVTCDRFEDVYYVECRHCSVKVETHSGAEDAIVGWNALAIDRDELLKYTDAMLKYADECERAGINMDFVESVRVLNE